MANDDLRTKIFRMYDEGGYTLTQEDLNYLKRIDYNLSYLLPKNCTKEDEIIDDVKKLLEKGDTAHVTELLKNLSNTLHELGQMNAYNIIMNSLD